MSYYYHIKGQKKNWEQSLFLTLETAHIYEMLGNQVTIGKKEIRLPARHYWNTPIYQTGTPINLAIVINESSQNWTEYNNLTNLFERISFEENRNNRVYQRIDTNRFAIILYFNQIIESSLTDNWEQEGF